MYDAVIIGGGHNGLTCAAYLAMAGLKRRRCWSGAAWSAARRSRRSFIPASAIPSRPTRSRLLHPQGDRANCASPITACASCSAGSANFLPLDETSYLRGRRRAHQARGREVLGARRRAAGRVRRAARSRRRRAARAGDRDAAERRRRAAACGDLRTHQVPAARAGASRQLASASQRDLLDLFTTLARRLCSTAWFETAPIKAAVRLRRHRRQLREPSTPGSAYVLLHHCLRRGERQARASGATRIGGMGAITQAMAARRRGRTASRSDTDAPVRESPRREGPGRRRRPRDGAASAPAAVLATCNPQLLYQRGSMPAGALPAGFVDAHRAAGAAAPARSA